MLSTLFLILGLFSVGFGLYLLKNKKRQPGKYVWVGQGEDPFKE